MTNLFILILLLGQTDSAPSSCPNKISAYSEEPSVSNNKLLHFYFYQFALPERLLKLLRHNIELQRQNSPDFSEFVSSILQDQAESYDIYNHPRLVSDGHFINNGDSLLISVHRLSYRTTKFGPTYELGQIPDKQSIGIKLSQARSLQDLIYALLIVGFQKSTQQTKRVSFYAREVRSAPIIDWLLALGFHVVDEPNVFPTLALHLYRLP